MAIKRFARVREMVTETDERTGITTVREHFLAELTNSSSPRRQILIAKPDLAPFQPHPEEPTARLMFMSIEQRKHSLLFDVLPRWSSDITVPENPLDEPAKITVETVSTTVPFTIDADGHPNTNTAGDLLEDAEDDEPMLVFRVSKKITPDYPSWLLDYGFVLNSDSVTFKGRTCPPKTLKLARIRIGDEQIQDDTPFLPLELEIIYNRHTWEKQFLNRGLQEIQIVRRPKPGEPGAYEYFTIKGPILDDTGKPVTTPQFLDDDGRRPRVDELGRRLTIERELQLLNDATAQFFKYDDFSRLKRPLDPDDIIILKRTRRKPRPFNGVLPLA